MRIISIGVEDKPPPSEFTGSQIGSEPDAEPNRGGEEFAGAPLPAFEISETTELEPRTVPAPLPAFEASESAETEHLPQLAPLPAFEISQAGAQQPQTELAPLPAFEMPESDQEAQDAATAPLPAFEMPDSDLQPPEPVIAPLPAFEILKPVEAPQDLELVPLALAPVAEPPPLFEQPPPLPKRVTVEPVELAEDDVAPDSIHPGPKEPPAPPSRTAAAALAAAPLASAQVAPLAPESSEVAGASTKRNPPPPPRRSFPAPSEVLAAVTGVDQAQLASGASTPGLALAEATSEKPKSEEKTGLRARRPWWEELFNEEYSRALSRLSDEQIRREASFIEESLGVAQGGVLLDLGCGPGYHAVELAERGYAVVGYDLSLHQLALAADVAQERHQKLNLMQGDMREMAFDAVFDGIYCWNTTFGYFEEEKNLAVAERIFKALKPGGTFLVNVINRDFVTMQQPSSVWFEGDSAVCMDDMTVDFISSRLRVKRSVMLDDGRTRECHYSIRLYSLHELGKLLHDVGFRVAEASGDPSTPGVFMGQNAPRIIILAQRP